MASDKQQAQAEVYRMESEVRSARAEYERVLRGEQEYLKKGIDRVGPARAALQNAERALAIAKDQLRRS